MLWASFANASLFPNDTLQVYSHYPNSGGTTCNDLISAVNHPITILYASIRTSGGANAGTITIDGTTYLDNNSLTDVETLAPITINNQAVGCTRANNKQFSFRVAYVNYDLKLVPNYQVNLSSKSFPDTVKLASGSYMINDYPILDLWLGFLSFFGIFFAIIFYFRSRWTRSL